LNNTLKTITFVGAVSLCQPIKESIRDLYIQTSCVELETQGNIIQPTFIYKPYLSGFGESEEVFSTDLKNWQPIEEYAPPYGRAFFRVQLKQ